MSLTLKQAQFVREYLVDLNATQAAIRCGYSAKTAEQQASRLLRNVKIASAVQDAMAKRAARTEITADRVLQELAKIGFSDIRKVVRWGNVAVEGAPDQEPDEELEPQPHGGALRRSRLGEQASAVELIGSDEIDDDTAAAVAEISQGPQGLKIKLHDKKGALVDIGRHLGMFTDKIDLTAKHELSDELKSWLDQR